MNLIPVITRLRLNVSRVKLASGQPSVSRLDLGQFRRDGGYPGLDSGIGLIVLVDVV
jgi:hypothetical protein